MGFVVGIGGAGKGLLLSTSVFLCHFNPTDSPFSYLYICL